MYNLKLLDVELTDRKLKKKEIIYCLKMFCAGMRAFREYDIRTVMVEFFCADNRRSHFPLHSLCGTKRLLGYMYGSIVHQRHSRL